MLFWEALQCNKRFRSFIVDSNRYHDYVILCLFYVTEYRNDPAKQGLVKLCIFILQTLSAEANFGKNLNMKFEAQDTLPQSIRLPNFNGTYGDFLIMVGIFEQQLGARANRNSQSIISWLQAKEHWMEFILRS